MHAHGIIVSYQLYICMYLHVCNKQKFCEFITYIQKQTWYKYALLNAPVFFNIWHSQKLFAVGVIVNSSQCWIFRTQLIANQRHYINLLKIRIELKFNMADFALKMYRLIAIQYIYKTAFLVFSEDTTEQQQLIGWLLQILIVKHLSDD